MNNKGHGWAIDRVRPNRPNKYCHEHKLRSIATFNEASVEIQKVEFRKLESNKVQASDELAEQVQ